MRAALRTAAVTAVLLVGCGRAPVGDYEPVKESDVPQGKAVVFIYRPPSLLGTLDVCNMEIGEEVIGGLDSGRYTHLFVEPGKIRFQTDGAFEAIVTVNVREGAPVFIRQTWGFGPSGLRPRLENMTRIKAEAELASCIFVEDPPMIPEPSSDGEGEDSQVRID
jgi:hypothetical protein